jgi:hypothetical protein
MIVASFLIRCGAIVIIVSLARACGCMCNVEGVR